MCCTEEEEGCTVLRFTLLEMNDVTRAESGGSTTARTKDLRGAET